MPGPGRPEPRPTTDPAKHSTPQLFWGPEDLFSHSLAPEPGTSQKFTYELPRTPTCQPHIYADVDVRVPHQLNRGFQVQHPHVPKQASPSRWFLPWTADLGQAERCLLGNGSALEEGRRRCEQITEMFQGVNHGNSPHPVETNPEAAFFVVFQQQHDATIEVASSTRLS